MRSIWPDEFEMPNALTREAITAIKEGNRELFEGLASCSGIRTSAFDTIWTEIRKRYHLEP